MIDMEANMKWQAFSYDANDWLDITDEEYKLFFDNPDVRMRRVEVTPIVEPI